MIFRFPYEAAAHSTRRPVVNLADEIAALLDLAEGIRGAADREDAALRGAKEEAVLSVEAQGRGLGLPSEPFGSETMGPSRPPREGADVGTRGRGEGLGVGKKVPAVVEEARRVLVECGEEGESLEAQVEARAKEEAAREKVVREARNRKRREKLKKKKQAAKAARQAGNQGEEDEDTTVSGGGGGRTPLRYQGAGGRAGCR